MERPWIFAFSAFSSAALALACSSSAPLGAGTAAGSGGVAGGGPSSGGMGGEALACVAPGYQSDSVATEIDEVDAKLVDATGAPVSDLMVQVCGLDACFNGSTNLVGQTDVAPGQTLLRPAFKYGDGFDFAKLAALLGSHAKQDLGELTALQLPDYADGAAFPKSGAVTNGDVTLLLASGTTVAHDLLTYTDDSELVFRSVAIPLADSTQAVDPNLGFELGYSVAPVSSTFCPPAGLRVKNSLGWAPSTAVEVFVQGLEVDEKWAPYGGWLKVADARVSADSSSIETTSGGIPILSSIALRRK
jgi:hypothetical protein